MDINVTINDTYIDWLDKKQATQIFLEALQVGRAFFFAKKSLLIV